MADLPSIALQESSIQFMNDAFSAFRTNAARDFQELQSRTDQYISKLRSKSDWIEQKCEQMMQRSLNHQVYEDRFRTLSEQIAQLLEQNKVWSDKTKELEAKNKEMAEMLKRQENINSQNEARFLQYQKEVKDLKDKNEKLTKIMEEQKNEVIMLQLETENFAVKNENYDVTFNKHEERMKFLNHNSETLSEKIKGLQCKMEATSDENAELRLSFLGSSDKMKKVEDKILNLQQKYEEFVKISKELELGERELERGLEMQGCCISKHGENLSEMESVVELLSSKHEKVVQRQQSQEKKRNEDRNQFLDKISHLHILIDRLFDKNMEMKEEQTETDLQIKMHESKIRCLDENFSESIAKTRKVCEKCEDLLCENSRLRPQDKKYKREIEALNVGMERLRSQNKLLEKKFETLRERYLTDMLYKNTKCYT